VLDGKPPAVRAAVARFVALARTFGPVRVEAQRRILALQVVRRFAELTPRTRWLDGAIWLARRRPDPRFRRIFSASARNHLHWFRVAAPQEIDRGFRPLLREAYSLGERRHVKAPPSDATLRRGRDAVQRLGRAERADVRSASLARAASRVRAAADGRATRPPLWTCPRCGHRFVTRNLWHSCGRHSLDSHFAGKDPAVRRAFDRVCELLRRRDAVTFSAQRTRIVFQLRMRFGSAIARRRWLQVGFALPRVARHPRCVRVHHWGPGLIAHTFRFERPEQVDRAFAKLLPEACAIGRQDGAAR
jgi:hypothetical protein